MTADEEQAARLRVRMKRAIDMMTTAAYALIGGSAWKPITEGRPLAAFAPWCMALGLALIVLVIGYAPEGENLDA